MILVEVKGKLKALLTIGCNSYCLRVLSSISSVTPRTKWCVGNSVTNACSQDKHSLLHMPAVLCTTEKVAGSWVPSITMHS